MKASPNGITSPSTGFANLPFLVDGVPRTAAIYVPPQYDEMKTWPLFVYLHGGGGTGDNEGNAVSDWMESLPVARAIRENPERFPALVLMPRCPKAKIWAPVPPDPVQSPWRLEMHGRIPALDAESHVSRAIDAAIASYAVDEERITLGGHSMGGEGSTRYAALNSDRLAAVAPSAGSAVIVLEDVLALSRIGVWMFQGECDELSTADLARRMAAALRDAGGEAHYTEYKGVGHGFADLVYSDAEFIRWLWTQRRKA